MAVEPLDLGDESPDDDVRLRPKRIAEMVGQREVKERLDIALDAAKKRDDAFPHLLLDGPPGLGKTTIASCLPSEMGADVQLTSGAIMKAPRDLVPFLTNATQHSFIFIDEIHRMHKAVEEYLYTAMEDFRIDIILGEGVNARTLNLDLKRFTLIGATTRSGMLSAPLRDRFPLREHLDFYEVDDLKQIVTRNAAKLGVGLDDNAADEIALRSRGTPRIANNLLQCVRDYALSKSDGHIRLETAMAGLKMWDVDPVGLNKPDRKYLQTLMGVFGGGPAGVESIAHTMNESPDTLADEVEPFLLRIGFVVRTPRGRVATPKAYEHLEIDPPVETEEDDPQGRLF